MGIGLMNHSGFLGDSTAAEIMAQLELFRTRTQETAEDLRKMEQEQEAFAIQYHECTKLNGNGIFLICVCMCGGSGMLVFIYI